MRYAFFLVSTLILCFAWQTLALRMVGGRTMKSESNFFSSIGRIQAGVRGDSRIMLLGSSITGRLPDRAQGFEGVVNMGCDGGSAIDVLRAMNEGILPCAPMLIIEANTLHRALLQRPSEISAAMQTPWFAAGAKVPNLAAFNRPSAFFYSSLLAMRIGKSNANANADLGVEEGPKCFENSTSVALSAAEEELTLEVVAILTSLRKRGSRAMLVWLPPGRGHSERLSPFIREIARRGNIPYWDLGGMAPSDAVVLTDGVHMSAPTATKTVNSLIKACQLKF